MPVTDSSVERDAFGVVRCAAKRKTRVGVVAIALVLANGCAHARQATTGDDVGAAGSIRTIAGGASSELGAGALATEASIHGAAGIAVDNGGRVYVASFLANRVMRIDPDGRLSVVAGTGLPKSTGDGGPADRAALHGPSAISLDLDGLLVAEQLGGRIRRIDLTSGTISTVQQGMSQPAGIAIHGGTIYITDFAANRLVTRSASGEVRTLAGTGQRSSTGDGGPAIEASLAGPTGVAVDGAGRIYVAEVFSHSVRRIDPDGTIRTVLGGTDNRQAALSRPAVGVPYAPTLRWPQSLAIDRSGAVLVTDFALGNVYSLTADGGAKPAISALSNADGAWGLAATPSGDIYVTSFNRGSVTRYSPSGAGKLLAGAPRTQRLGGAAESMRFSSLSGVAVDANGQILMSEAFAHRVWALRDNRIVLFAGAGDDSGAGSRASTVALNQPVGIVPSGNGVYIIEAEGHRIRRVESDGSVTAIAGDGRLGFSGDGGLAVDATLAHPHYGTIVGPFDPTGRTVGPSEGFLVFVDTDNHRVRRIRNDGRIETIAGTGKPESSGNGGRAIDASLNRPEAVVADARGNLYVSEAHRVRKIDVRGIITTVAGNGKRGFAGDGGPAVQATLDSPYGLAVHGLDLFIADSWNNVVWRVDAEGIASVIAGTTRKASDGDGGPARLASLNAPIDLAIQRQGSRVFLLVAELEGARLRSIRIR